MISVNHLTKDYEKTRALDDVSFHVKEGAFFALLGPNGAGKSTTIEIVSTLKGKTSGDVKVNGATLGKDDDQIRKAIGVVFQYSTLDDDLTAYENLFLRGRFYTDDKTAIHNRIQYLQDFLGFKSYVGRRVKTLSGGQRRKIDIARALLHEPRVLLLDEPTTGLDPQSRENIWELVLELKKKTNMTIVLTTHYMEEVADCDQVIILHEGKIRAEDSAEKLRANYATDKLRVLPKDNGLENILKKEKIAYSTVQNTLHIPLRDSFEGLDYVERFKESIETFEIVKGTMDDVFLNITGRKLSDYDDRLN